MVSKEGCYYIILYK